MRFDDLRLAEPILRAVRAEGYTTPTPIQMKAIPPVLEGRDVLGCAQTGTGKTAAFTLPILHRLIDAGRQRPQADRRGPRPIRVLVLAPTRELAAQIGDCTAAYARYTQIRHGVIFGGVGQAPQVRSLRDGIDILVATPGRLLDLMEQGFVNLSQVEVLVLDEADRMLDMGFIHDIRKVVAKVPRERQTLLFSATVPDDIRQLAATLLRKPVGVQVAPVSAAADTVEQSVYFVEKRSKPALLEHFLNNNAVGRALVFTRTKHGADKVARHLSRAGIRAEAIHGNKSQNARVRAMQSFKSGAPPVLVATDIAARGLDIDEISHVINFDVPNVPETYVHRIGRTGRAGASGLAVSFCDESEVPFLRDIERLIRRSIPSAGTVPQLPAPQERPARETRAARPQRPEHGRQAVQRRRPQREEGTQQRSAPRESIAAPALTLAAAPTGVGHRSRGRSRTRRGLARRR